MTVTSQIQQNATAGQFGVSQVPFHVHNGVDSPSVPVRNLGIMSGQAKMALGTVTITDPRINRKSVITATSTIAHATGSVAAICNSGNAVIFDGSGTNNDTVNYIIIINP